MSDEVEEKNPSKEIDGITANGVNSFTSERFQIALVVKPKLTAGDLDAWLKDFRTDPYRPVAADRVELLFNAVKANIIVYSTDKLTPLTMKECDGERASWYGMQLIPVYNRFNFIDPN